MNMKLEVVIIPVSDVDRAKAFYEKLGFRLDIDIVNENFRGIQFTPPNSEASIIFGQGITSARSGSVDLVLAVDNVDAAREDLDRPRRKRQRDFPLRRWPLQQRCGEPARRWTRPRRSFLLLVCLVRGSRRERLATPGDHDAPSWPDRLRSNDVWFGERSGERASACRGRSR
jgi:catechol 2,3-dioxygenase-like lactoylglutathione lyase family enzyme